MKIKKRLLKSLLDLLYINSTNNLKCLVFVWDIPHYNRGLVLINANEYPTREPIGNLFFSSLQARSPLAATLLVPQRQRTCSQTTGFFFFTYIAWRFFTRTQLT